MAARENEKPVGETERAGKDILKIGFDLGTNCSVVQAEDGSGLTPQNDLIPTVIGYPKAGVLPGILPKGKDVVFGEEAIAHRVHVDLVWPLARGVISDLKATRDLIKHVRNIIDPTGEKKIWAVMGAPVNARTEDLRAMRAAVAEVFAKLLVVPEPFLAAMGYRDEEKAGSTDYDDPTRHSLFIDIGAGTTDLCLIQGYFPTAEEQVCIRRAGNDIDLALAEGIRRTYPDVKLAPTTVTKLKENNSYVGQPKARILARVLVEGKPRKIDITRQIKEGCEILMDDIVENIGILVGRADSETAENVLKNIILTGGGSLIGNICEELERILHERGYEDAKVRRVEDYKRLVAKGALKTALRVKNDQWQLPM